MIIPDANILLYAHVPNFQEHKKAKAWLETTISDGNNIIGLPWQVITAFIRIGTNPRIFQVPFKIEDAVSRLDNLLIHPLVQTVAPTDKHWQVFAKILREEQISADLVMDAHLAALAIEQKARIATTDRDFLRFSKIIKVFNPLES